MEDYYLGGLDTFVINLINNWPDSSDCLTFICNNKHTGLDFIEASLRRPCTIIRHNLLIFSGIFELTEKNNKINNFFVFILRLFSPVLKYVFLVYNIFALKKILLKNSPDRLMIIHGGYPGGDSCRAASIAWGLFSKKPYSIHNFHGIVLKPKWHIKFQELLVDTLVSRFSKAFVTVSKAAADSMLSRGRICKKHKISYIFNGIEVVDGGQNKNAVDLKTVRGSSSSGPLCLTLGGYHRHKNFDKGHYFLFQVFKKIIQSIPGAQLLVCGYGTPASIEKVRKLVLESGLERNVNLHGFRNDVSCLLSHSEVLLIGSQVFESFCLASIEAMAHHVPVVATNVGAVPEIVLDGQGGYCFDKEDVDSYADCVIKLLKNESLKKEQGQRGYQRYKEFFTASRMAGEYAKIVHG